MRELSYDQLAKVLGVSPRHARTVVQANADLIQPIAYSYKNKRFPVSQVFALKARLRARAMERGIKEARSKILASDRYGGPANWPNPKTMCTGQCEGTGSIPVKSDERNKRLRALWLQAEKKQHAKDGWHFVKCPDCAGTGKRRAS